MRTSSAPSPHPVSRSRRAAPNPWRAPAELGYALSGFVRQRAPRRSCWGLRRRRGVLATDSTRRRRTSDDRWRSKQRYDTVAHRVRGHRVGGARNHWKWRNSGSPSWRGCCVNREPACRRRPCSGWRSVRTRTDGRRTSRSVWKISLLMRHFKAFSLTREEQHGLVCAFQPNRAMVPSLPLVFAAPDTFVPNRLKWPKIPRFSFTALLAAMFGPQRGIVRSPSTRPIPKTGVGMRKMTSCWRPAPRNSPA